MNRQFHVFALVLLLLALGGGREAPGASADPRAEPASPAAQGESPIDLAIGGCGGVYFLAEPGELIVEIDKRDRNRSARRTELRAILAGPDRAVLQDVTLPDDGLPANGKLGPPRRARLSTRVDRKGVYVLNVTVSQDRYGEAMLWGFRTNCPRYLIETSRGHRDERHQEPIVLWKPDRPGDVCFLPRRGPIEMEITNLPAGSADVQVFDGEGKLAATLRVDAGGRAAGAFPADPRRPEKPWRLHLPVQQATVNIGGVTRWDRDDEYADLSYWTPEAASFFPFHRYRWLLTPYRRQAFSPFGGQGEVTFRVHNNSDQTKTVRLQIEFPASPWPARLSTEQVQLGAKEGKEVSVRYTAPAEPGESQVCHIRATPAEDPEFSTYSTLTVRAGVAPAAQPLTLPLVLKAYEHENELLGYLPDYPVENQVYFDLTNQPFVVAGGAVLTWRDGVWVATDVQGGARPGDGSRGGRSWGLASSKIAFDRDGDMYLLASAGGRPALLHSADGGKTFDACPIPGRGGQHGAWDIESSSGHNTPDGPPPILCYTQTAADPKRIWRRINDLELYLPQKAGGRVAIGQPVLVSKQCIGLAAHSGIPSTVVSRGSKVHVVWAEATDPAEKVPGVPTFVATYDRPSRTLGKPALVGYGPPANDVHNTPSITMDSQGYLHVLVGTHGQPFPYARSLKPNDAQSGWSEAVLTGEGLAQTYIGLVCGPDDTLHAVFRLWQHGKEPFPASHHATLAYQRKRPGKPWEAPRVLIVPPFSEYSVYYHRLTIDRAGRLFLSYDYWSTYWFYRTDHPGRRRALLMSPDGGETWKLAETRDLVASR